MQKHYQISALEMAIVLIGVIVGAGILFLPRQMAESMGTADGWISILISGGITMILVSLIVRLSRHFPGQTLFQYIGKTSIGKFIEKVLLLLFSIYFLCFLGFEARVLTLITRMYLLDRTPPEVTVVIILLTVAYATTKGVQGIVHLSLLFFPTVTFVYLLLIIFNIGNGSLDALLPVMPMGFSPVLQGLKISVISFLGISVLFFWIKYMEQKNIRALPLNIAIAFITVLYVLVVVFTFSVFSVPLTGVLTFPTVTLAKEVQILEGLIERFEPLMISIWVIAIFNTMAIIQLLVIQAIKSTIKKTSKKKWVLGFVTSLVYLITFIPNTIEEVFTLGEQIGYFGLILTCSSIAIGFLFVIIRSSKQTKIQKGGKAL